MTDSRFTDEHFAFLAAIGPHETTHRLIACLAARACRRCLQARGENPDTGRKTCVSGADPYESRCKAMVAELEAVMTSPELLKEVMADA